MKLAKYLEELNGTEISSIHYEGVVGIEDGKVIMGGDVIDTLNIEKAKILLDEMFRNEFGPFSLSELF